MRYTNHIILDIQTITRSATASTWQGDYAQLIHTNAKLNKPSFSTLTLVKPKKINKTLPVKALNIFVFDTFNIHFIRKEKLYAKLKYSRCPQYDIVSGGFAALLAGFTGFLIGEKFGIELVDAGDFYNALMYGVFIVFSIGLILRTHSRDTSTSTILTFRYLLTFLYDLALMCLMAIRRGYLCYPTSPKLTGANVRFITKTLLWPISLLIQAPRKLTNYILALMLR